jgi:hypothetical protein
VLANIRPSVGATLEPVYKEIIKLFSDRAIANRGVTKADRGFQEIYDGFMSTIGGQHITDISDTTRRQIMTVISNNQTEGVAVTSKAITDRMSPRFTRARASTISRTETHSASSFANHEQYKSFNEPTMMKRWVANADDRTRPSHYAVSGTEIGIDDTFSVAGKLMKYTGDPSGGASEVINCRCVTIYFESEDVFVDATTETPPPVVPTQDAILRRRATSDTVRIISRAKAVKILKERFEEANKDARYPKGERKYQGSNDNYGNVSGQITKKKATDETLSSIVTIVDELDELADIMNVPKLRGIATVRKSSKAPIASMGDGVMNVNVDNFNDWSSGVGKPKPSKAELLKVEEAYKTKRSGFMNELDELDENIRNQAKQEKTTILNLLTDKPELLDRRNALQKELRDIDNEFRVLKKSAPLNISTWKFGDELKNRPHNGFQYYEDGYERLRNTMLHEFGHHVHQQFKVNGSISAYFTPKLEDALTIVQGRRRSPRVAGGSTRYADTNGAEWWAENFALWVDNKLELVDPRFVTAIKRVINDLEPEDIL